MALSCPSCRAEMEPVSFFGLALDACGQCAGIWFDSGELAQLAREAPAALDMLEDKFVPEIQVVSPDSKKKHCPRCGDVLETFRYQYDSPVRIDSCGQCSGVFVEDQELHAIKEFIDEEDAVRMTSLMQARGRLTEYKGTQIGAQTKDGGVAVLLHALRHWRDHRDSG